MNSALVTQEVIQLILQFVLKVQIQKLCYQLGANRANALSTHYPVPVLFACQQTYFESALLQYKKQWRSAHCVTTHTSALYKLCTESSKVYTITKASEKTFTIHTSPMLDNEN